MVIYFSGIGGVGIGPLAEIARDAGHTVFGSDTQSGPITEQLSANGINVTIGQDGSGIAQVHATNPIDWFVFSASIADNNPERVFATEHGIRSSKRDELLAHIIDECQLKVIAVAGTHGKTTTTSMLVWCFKQLGLPVSYSVGTTIGFGTSGVLEKTSDYFVYECDEYDRNFLHFWPTISVIPAIGYDHPDTYKTEHEYKSAFLQFIEQSNFTVLWEKDRRYLESPDIPASYEAYDDYMDLSRFHLPGAHIRQNAFLVMRTLEHLLPEVAQDRIVAALNTYPGSGRRFEKLGKNLYSDYGHHPTEIAATLQLARELSEHIVLVYQPHQNVRQHEIRADYTPEVFKEAEEIFWLPTYLSREDPALQVLSPEELSKELVNSSKVRIANLDDELWEAIESARAQEKLVLVMGAGSIDSWVRQRLA